MHRLEMIQKNRPSKYIKYTVNPLKKIPHLFTMSWAMRKVYMYGRSCVFDVAYLKPTSASSWAPAPASSMR